MQEVRGVPAHGLRRVRVLPRHGEVRRTGPRQADLRHATVSAGDIYCYSLILKNCTVVETPGVPT